MSRFRRKFLDLKTSKTGYERLLLNIVAIVLLMNNCVIKGVCREIVAVSLRDCHIR
jgi:hypothetical protein